MATELILIRHGNAVRVNGDYMHAPLTSLGQEQAAQTGEYFNAPQNHQEVRLIESLALVILEFFFRSPSLLKIIWMLAPAAQFDGQLWDASQRYC